MNDTEKVSISLGFTFNLGNFESLRVDAGATVNLQLGETVSQGLDRANKEVAIWLDRWIKSNEKIPSRKSRTLPIGDEYEKQI